jgi:hypothetical protein
MDARYPSNNFNEKEIQMETILLATLIITAPFLAVVSLIFSEPEKVSKISSDKNNHQLEQQLKKAA